MREAQKATIRPQSRELSGEKGVVFAGGAPGLHPPSHATGFPSVAWRIFLLSPANGAGARAQMLLRDGAEFELAQRLRAGGATLGEIFSFMSGLYFRGKLAYAQAFADPPREMPGALIITPSRGLLPAETVVTLREMRGMCAAQIDLDNANYREPLERDARLLLTRGGRDVQIVLLGSIATPKYVEPLLPIFGHQLLFPLDFVARGDLSRGGLLLRCCRLKTALVYAPVATTMRNGKRSARLPRMPKGQVAKSE